MYSRNISIIPAMSTVEVPCYGCPDRIAGCHSNCERYKNFRDKRMKQLERKNKFEGEQWRATDHIIRGIYKAKRRAKR